MENIKEVKLSGEKTYISPHDGFTLAFMNGNEKKYFKFTNGRLLVKDPADVALIDAEYDRRYLLKDADGNPLTDAAGKKQYGGEMKFIPMDEYEKSRLLQPVIVKTKSGKTYKITEGDLVAIAERAETGELGPLSSTVSKEQVRQTILETLEEMGIDTEDQVVTALTDKIFALFNGPEPASAVKNKPKKKTGK